MGSQRPAVDVVRTVARRREFLSCLEDGPRTKRDLADRLDRSRSTVDRAVRELEWLNCLWREDDAYRLTTAGRLALSEYRRSVGVLESIGAAGSFLEDVPRDAPLSVALLDGADVTEPPSYAPNEPFRAVGELIDRADRFRAVLAADRSPQVRSRLYDRVVEDGLDGEAILTTELAAFVRETYPDRLRRLAAAGFDCFALESVPYELRLVETPTTTRVFVFVFDDPAEIRGVIENDTASAVAWGEAVYRQFRAAATPLSPSE